jgi:hypothetical protein
MKTAEIFIVRKNNSSSVKSGVVCLIRDLALIMLEYDRDIAMIFVKRAGFNVLDQVYPITKRTPAMFHDITNEIKLLKANIDNLEYLRNCSYEDYRNYMDNFPLLKKHAAAFGHQRRSMEEIASIFGWEGEGEEAAAAFLEEAWPDNNTYY